MTQYKYTLPPVKIRRGYTNTDLYSMTGYYSGASNDFNPGDGIPRLIWFAGSGWALWFLVDKPNGETAISSEWLPCPVDADEATARKLATMFLSMCDECRTPLSRD